MEIIIGILIIILIFTFLIAAVYNNLIQLRNRVKDQWAQIDVLLKRRSDLIPNLVEIVKGYAKHESSTLEAVINARSKATSATTSKEELSANNELTQALGRLMVLTENYPELKADKNFLQLQNDLSETEDKISLARQFYNDVVLQYNNKVEMFPSNIIAGMFNFVKADFFEISNNDKEVPKIKF